MGYANRVLEEFGGEVLRTDSFVLATSGPCLCHRFFALVADLLLRQHSEYGADPLVARLNETRIPPVLPWLRSIPLQLPLNLHCCTFTYQLLRLLLLKRLELS